MATSTLQCAVPSKITSLPPKNNPNPNDSEAKVLIDCNALSQFEGLLKMYRLGIGRIRPRLLFIRHSLAQPHSSKGPKWTGRRSAR